VLLGLSTGQKVGLLIAAGIFIAFALAASFYFPRRNPDFPGHRLGSFVALTLVLFLGTLTTVFVLAKEDEAEAEGHGEVVATETSEEGEEGPAATGGETGETAETGGDPAAGKQVFASAGCGGCHILEDAGTSGNVGPSLDESQPSNELVVDRVTNGQGAMPAFGDQLSEEEIQNVAAYVVQATGGS
jgi:mono/diheme cytochrome c family protein